MYSAVLKFVLKISVAFFAGFESISEKYPKTIPPINYKSYFPKFEYTTDNAAMIAMVGYLKYKNNDFSSIEKVHKLVLNFNYAIILFNRS